MSLSSIPNRPSTSSNLSTPFTCPCIWHLCSFWLFSSVKLACILILSLLTAKVSVVCRYLTFPIPFFPPSVNSRQLAAVFLSSLIAKSASFLGNTYMFKFFERKVLLYLKSSIKRPTSLIRFILTSSRFSNTFNKNNTLRASSNSCFFVRCLISAVWFRLLDTQRKERRRTKSLHVPTNNVPFPLYGIEDTTCTWVECLRCLFWIIEECSDVLCWILIEITWCFESRRPCRMFF